jgi:hypothetical protein
MALLGQADARIGQPVGEIVVVGVDLGDEPGRVAVGNLDPDERHRVEGRVAGGQAGVLDELPRLVVRHPFIHAFSSRSLIQRSDFRFRPKPVGSCPATGDAR